MHAECNRQSQERQGAERGRSAGDRVAQENRKAASLPQTHPAFELQSAWISLLSRYQWDLFGSLTFRDETHPESAMKRFRLFISMINRKLYGPRWAKHNKGVSWCVAVERQARGVLHFHCLLADPELTNLLKGSWFKLDGRWANELNEMWNEVAGFARIEPIKVHELVQRYVSKYVIKGGQIDLGGPMMQRRLEQAAAGSNATEGQRGGRDLGDISGSVPVPPGGAKSRGERLDVQDTSSRSPYLFIRGCRAVRSDLGKRAASTKRMHGAPAIAEQAVLAAVTTPEEREKLLARYGTAPRRETADLLDAVRVRVLAYKAGHRELAA